MIYHNLNKKLTYIHFVLFMILGATLIGQDLHYSQFYNSPLNQNPGLTGVFNGDQRFTMSYRDQWRYVPVPWQTFTLSYDTKLMNLGEKAVLNIGGNFNYDRQGDSRMNLSGINGAGSVSYLLNAHNVITGGILLGVASRAFDESDLTWDKQWDLEKFDPALSSGESFDANRIVFMETGLGANYRLQKDSRSKIDLGVGAYHIYRPTNNFISSDPKRLPTHITLSAVGSVKIVERLDIQLQALHQLQDNYRETLLGGLAKIYVATNRGQETELHLGLGYRTTNSLIPTLAVQYKDVYASFSFDIDRTEFNSITNNNRGGPEIHLRYIITKVKPLEDRKVCPIY